MTTAQIQQKKELEEFLTEWQNELIDLFKLFQTGEDFSTIVENIKTKLKSQDFFLSTDTNSLKILLNSVITTIILLHKQGLLREFEHFPQKFITSFISNSFPIINNEVFHNYVNITADENMLLAFHDKLHTLPMVDRDHSYWNYISKYCQEIKLFDWDKLSEIKDNLKMIHIKTESHPSVHYNKYLKILNEELRDRILQPDLVIVDTILISEYREKGIFSSVHNYIDETKFSDLEKQIGKTINGRMEALPLTRNFHIAAWGYNNNEYKDKFVTANNEPKQVNYDDFVSGVIYRNAINCWEMHNQNSLEQSFIKNASTERFFIKIDGKQLHTPMQLARGAHVVYTLYAYMAGRAPNNNCLNFISAEKTKEDKVCVFWWQKKIIKKAITDFFKFTYAHVPACSLTLDQKLSLHHKVIYNDWFDICATLESIFELKKNQTAVEVNHSSGPTKSGSYSLSCIGGYCIALSSDSRSKSESVAKAEEIIKQLFQKDINSESKKFSNLTLKVNYETNENEEKKLQRNNYLTLPNTIKLAKRPNFAGWSVLEEKISEITRNFITVLFVFRSLFFEAKCIRNYLTNDGNKSTLSDLVLLKDIRTDIPNSTLGILHAFISLGISIELINTYLDNVMNSTILAFRQYTTRNETEFIINNLESLKNESYTITSLLKSTFLNSYNVKTLEENISELFIDELANNFSNILDNELKTMCNYYDWNIKESQ